MSQWPIEKVCSTFNCRLKPLLSFSHKEKKSTATRKKKNVSPSFLWNTHGATDTRPVSLPATTTSPPKSNHVVLQKTSSFYPFTSFFVSGEWNAQKSEGGNGRSLCLCKDLKKITIKRATRMTLKRKFVIRPFTTVFSACSSVFWK